MHVDDQWAMDRMRSRDDLAECTSFRVELDGVVHRFVAFKDGVMRWPRWVALCQLHPARCPPACDKPVSCVECIAEGG